MTLGPLLGPILGVAPGDDGEGFAGLQDDALVGFLSTGQRMESWQAWARMRALVEFGSRVRRKDFAADHISMALNLSWMQVAGDIAYATAVARRLPLCFAALRDGKLRPFDLKIIEEATRPLSDEDAAKADAELAGAAPGMTYGELRTFAAKLVLRLDPQVAKKRKEQAKRDTHVRSFREDSGNAGITGREMPSVEVLASMQHIAARARALREAGVPGTREELRVRAYLDLLQERDLQLTLDDLASGQGGSTPEGAGDTSNTGNNSSAGDNSAGDSSGSWDARANDSAPDSGQDGPPLPDAPSDPGPADGEPWDGEAGNDGAAYDGPADYGPADYGPAYDCPEDYDPGDDDLEDGDPWDSDRGNDGPEDDGPEGESGDGEPGGGSGPGGNGPGGGRGRCDGRGSGGGLGPAAGLGPARPVLAALVNITVPYSIWHGDAGPPGEVGGFGIVDHHDTRESVAAAARSPDSRWCITLLDPDGTAAAHGCAPGPRRWPTGPPKPATYRDLFRILKITTLDDVIRGPCDHAQEEHHYQPSRKLRHLVRARNATCTAPGCNRRAATCDLDHTSTYDSGGKTCPCNLSPLCRHHHRCKHSEGWRLEQPEPGVLRWHTPAGRTYITGPTRYSI